MNLVDQAAVIAMRAHHGQINQYDNEPYILHPHRVMIAVREGSTMRSGERPEGFYLAVAWLHDVLEDTEETYQSLLAQLQNPEVVTAVELLSKVKGEPNEEYYAKVRTNPLARTVKYFDVVDNFSRNHMIQDDDTRLRMAKKYSLGLEMLK